MGILSHDLRNPLGAARMSADLTLKMGAHNLNERQRMLLFQVIESADRATGIVDHLLDLTRARLGSGLPIIKEPMDIGFISMQMVDEMRAMHPDRAITLEITGDTKGEWDKPRIGQAFSNLLGNAIQYGFTNAPIAVRVDGHAQEVVVSVHNQGLPVPASVMDRIFDPLTRGLTEESEDTLGTANLGLGLYITREILAAHGGTIGVTSSETDGTTFTASFPRFPKGAPLLEAA